MNLVIVLAILAVISLAFGMYIQYAGKDLSGNTGFLFSSKKSIMPWLHILVGIVMGIALFPAKYKWGKDDNGKDKYEPNWMIWARQIVGISIYVGFTWRNMSKHPKNLAERLRDCGKSSEINLDPENKTDVFIASSVSRQQAQLMLGACIGMIVTHYAINKGKSTLVKEGIVFAMIIIITLGEYILQLVKSVSYSKSKQRFIECVKFKKDLNVVTYPEQSPLLM